MNILLATIFEYPHEGGLSTHMTILKKGLEERGHSVDVLSFSSFPHVYRTAYARLPGYVMNKWKKGKGQLWNDSQRRRLLFRHLQRVRHQYDVVNAQDIYAVLAAVTAGLPTVATVHGYYAYEAVSRGAIEEHSSEARRIEELEQEAYTLADQLVAVDRRIQQYIHRVANIEAIVIKNFIDIDSFRPSSSVCASEIRKAFQLPEDAPIVFVPRRLTEKNGVIYPVFALPKVLCHHPNTILVYAGTGEQQERIEGEMKKRGLQRHVRLLGSVPHEQMKQLYSIATVVLVPSVHSHGVEEATSISALEAMGSGVPVIAGAVGGLKEIFEHGVDGILVKDRDVDGLAAAIIQLLDDRSYGQRLAANARKKVEKEYSHRAAAEQFETVYIAAKRLHSPLHF
ncbi:glycosyltransferase family 4 protein [Geobacillus sp. LEMMJ02]|uniref:glycosyltransferase family 4 protein n=2 Tax=Anoxybacillaceae TaxID=3120669 RepID=UPI000407C5A6|nr:MULTISPECIES: glycosyltransferase family 4 protein [Geobacillus]AOL35803.1 glycosyl transferase family 1 [Geobacillus thermoleovorans]TRY36603.1 glycosyltransferase family 4 protein [Geobacillus sp. LEMMJ02]WMJ19756.1 glycosyltransferase family 4 protein [Geobacillus kaustophilus]